VTPDTAIVSYVPGDRGDLKPGTEIFVAANKQPDGRMQTPRITYGKDGLTPPCELSVRGAIGKVDFLF